MLLPALNMARDKAKAISCLSNMKQLQLSLLQYADDYDGYCVNQSQIVDGVKSYWTAPKLLGGYFNNPIRWGWGNVPATSIAVCPAAKGVNDASKLITDATYGDMYKDASIALNCWRGGNPVGLAQNVNWGGDTVKLVRISKTSKMISFIDGVSSSWSAGGWGDYPWHYSKDVIAVTGNDPRLKGTELNYADRHNGGVNMAFVDGHAKGTKMPLSGDADTSKFISANGGQFIAGQVGLH
jgi:prepilin-type processing-associated H-X9-DG protein